MKLQDRLKFRELLFLLLAGLHEYPGDRERAEAGMKVMEDWIDKLTAREISAIVSASSAIEQGGIVKGLGKNFKN